MLQLLGVGITQAYGRFAATSARRALISDHTRSPSLSFKIDGYSYFRLAALAADHGAAFLEVMGWVADELHQKAGIAA
jgi:hypothetical protein